MSPFWAASALLTGLLGTPQAQAHRRDFPFTYEWLQPARGEKEIESHSYYNREDHGFEQQLEFEYGVTDRLAVAPYVVYEKESGGELKYHAFKLESRYQLGNYKPGKILTGLYLEAEKPKDEKLEIESKLIFSRYDRQGGNLSLNLIGEKSLESGSDLLTTFSLGYARPIGQNKYSTRGGLELIRNLDDKHVTLGPVIGASLNQSLSLVGSYGIPVTKRDENKGELRLLVEYEWF